jgi:hypothetical protein
MHDRLSHCSATTRLDDEFAVDALSEAVVDTRVFACGTGAVGLEVFELFAEANCEQVIKKKITGHTFAQ